MSEYTSSYRSSRSPQSRNPLSYDPKVKIVTYPNIPRTYSSGGPLSVPKGMYVYPKPGEVIFFYEDFNGTKRQLRNKEQVQEPKREGNELVGTTTGKSEKGINGVFIEVSWVNSYKDHNLIEADVMKYDPRIGWVDSSKVEWLKEYISPEQKGLDSIPEPDSNIDSNGGGIDTTTLGYLAIGAALLFSTKKRGKK
jgi:hypothetical protein